VDCRQHVEAALIAGWSNLYSASRLALTTEFN
jgi:hypothetical protein